VIKNKKAESQISSVEKVDSASTEENEIFMNSYSIILCTEESFILKKHICSKFFWYFFHSFRKKATGISGFDDPRAKEIQW